MEEYISKSALVAEIERRMQELHPTNTHQMQVGEKMDRDVLMWLNALTWVKNFLNTLEAKEVDLEEYIDDFISNENRYVEYKTTWINEKDWRDSIKRCAKEFFELGLKAKGE